jgi:hypothetical protein
MEKTNPGPKLFWSQEKIRALPFFICCKKLKMKAVKNKQI